MNDLLKAIEVIARAAGQRILDVRARGLASRTKADGSPVTEADVYAEELILAELKRIDSKAAIVAEELNDAEGTVADVGQRFYLVDPLDGTKEYLKGHDDFTVNIALIENGMPVLGVVCAPARGETFSGFIGGGARRTWFDGAGVCQSRELRVRPAAVELDAVVSVSHMTPATQKLLGALTIRNRVSVGSSLKFCLVAAAEADIYPRLAPTMQWDTAAGDAVLRSAGGATIDRDGLPLAYGARAGDGHPFLNPEFIAMGGGYEGLLPSLVAGGWCRP